MFGSRRSNEHGLLNVLAVSPPGHSAPAPHNEEQIVGRIAVDEGAWISAT